MRLLVGPNHCYLIPAAGLAGGTLLIIADLYLDDPNRSRNSNRYINRLYRSSLLSISPAINKAPETSMIIIKT